MGRHGLGSMNENGEIFADFCVGSDHHLLVAQLKLKLAVVSKRENPNEAL